ncbi:MAG: hypothetical protein K5839_04815, partial [Treponemataceae bacterium]|nr:hypothetical protein [Treponemataceae bacterium]
TAVATPGLSVDTETSYAQSGTKASTVYLLKDPVSDQATLNLKGRFAVNHYTKSSQIYWLWRYKSSAAYNSGLGGGWNSKATELNTYFNFSILNLLEGDTVVVNYASKNDASKLYLCSGGVVASSDGTAMADSSILTSGAKYVVLKDGNLDCFVMNNNIGIQSVAITYTTTALPAPTITTEGEETGAVKVTVSDAEGTVYYAIDGGETQTYTGPFVMTTKGNVTAWYVSNDVESVVAEATVKAGVIAAPTVSVTKVNGIDRDVTIASATSVATLEINDVASANNFVETISASKDYVVVAKTATTIDEKEYVMSSDTTKVTIEAGSTIKLATPTTQIAAANYHYNLFDVLVNADQSSVLCAPAVKVVCVNPQGDTVTVASGEVVSNLSLGKFTAKAIAEGYDESDLTSRWLKSQPAYDTLAVYDFQNDADLVGATLAIGSEAVGTAWEIGNQRYQSIYEVTAPEKMAGKFAMQQVGNGASNGWWLRQNTSNLKYTGLCEGNSPRSAAILNLTKGTVVVFNVNTDNPDQINVQGGGDGDGEWTADIQGSALYVTMTKAGNLGFCLPKRTNPDVYIGSIIVMQSDAQTYDPSAAKVGAKDTGRFIELATTTSGADVYYTLTKSVVSEKVALAPAEGGSADTIIATPITAVNAKVKHVVESLDAVPSGYKAYTDLVTPAYNKFVSVNSTLKEGSETEYVYDTIVTEVPAVYEYYYYDNEVEEVTVDATTGYFHYDGPFLIDTVTTVKTYAEYQGLLSETPEYVFETGDSIKLNTPAFVWANAPATFNATVEAETKIDNDKADVPADLYYTLAGGEETKVTGTLVVPAENYGWMKLVAKAEGYIDSDVSWRYADARASHTEPYMALYNAYDTIPANIAKVGDVEIKAGLCLDSIPNAFTPAGRLFFH